MTNNLTRGAAALAAVVLGPSQRHRADVQHRGLLAGARHLHRVRPVVVAQHDE